MRGIRLVTAFGVMACIVAFWVIGFCFIYFSSFPLQDKGLFGDSFGVLNSFFSALAFGGVVVSLIIQSTDLKHTRESVARQADAAAEMMTLQKKMLVVELNKRIDEINEQAAIDPKDSLRRAARTYQVILKSIDS